MYKCKSFLAIVIITVMTVLILSSCASSVNTQKDVSESETTAAATVNETKETPAVSTTATQKAKPEENKEILNIDNNIAAFTGLPYNIRETAYKKGGIKIKYPAISGMKDTNVENKINDLIKNDAMKYVKSYDSEGAALDVGFQIAFAGNTLLSIKFIAYMNSPEAAHPNHSFYSSNIYIPMASKIKLTDMVKISDYFARVFKKNSKYVAPNKSAYAKLESSLKSYIDSVDGAYLMKADTEDESNECFSYFTKDSIGISVGVPFALGGYALYEIKFQDASSYIYHKNELWKNFPDFISKLPNAGNDSVTSNIYDIIPEGWMILERNGEKALKECDFDKDGNTDLVFVLEGTAANGESAPRTLMIASGNGDWTYTPAVEAKNAILKSDEGGMMGDPFGGIEIKNGSLYLRFYGGSSWRWDNTYQFRYQEGDWYLIGAKESTLNINTNEETVKDYNLLTGDYIVTQKAENGKVKETKGNYDKRNRYKLADFKAGKEGIFDFLK